jgi:predicted DNA-binding transcriptional regulator AlpA
MSNTENTILTDKDLCRYLKKSESWARQSRMKGDGPPFYKIGRSVRYRLSDVEAWLAERVRTNTIIRRPD